MKNNDWEKEFDEKFIGCEDSLCSKHQFKPELAGQLPKHLKDFISTLLAQTRQDTVREVIERMEKEEKEKWDDAHHCTCLSYVIDQLREEYGIKDK